MLLIDLTLVVISYLDDYDNNLLVAPVTMG